MRLLAGGQEGYRRVEGAHGEADEGALRQGAGDEGRLCEAVRVPVDGTRTRLPRLAEGVGGVEISDMTFWVAFYALVVGALGDMAL